MSFRSLLLSFAPWIMFKVIVKLPLYNPLTMVKIGIAVAAVICAYQAYTGLHKGMILYGGLLFFGFTLISVVFMSNMWVIKHLGILSHGTLAGVCWLSIIIGKPFTMEYAKQHVPEQFWRTAKFIRKNYIITGIWAVAFSINLFDAFARLYNPAFEGILLEIFDNGVMLVAIILTVVMSNQKRSAY